MKIFFKRSFACFFFHPRYTPSQCGLLKISQQHKEKNRKNLLTSAAESHWLRQQQMPALRRKDTGNPKCTRFHRCAQTASPKYNKEEDIGEGTHAQVLLLTIQVLQLILYRLWVLPGGHPAQFESSLPILA